MVIEIADNIMGKTKLSVGDLKLRIALILFAEEQVTLAQAAKIAGLHQMQFQKELAKRQMPIHYDETDFERDLLTIANMPV
jgi:predicted HTH domain antitoxin